MTNNKFYALIKEREAKSSALGIPSLPNSSQILILEDIRSLMMSYQRAAILATRGNHWTLLQNVARSLWNAINSLMLVTSKCNAEVKILNISAVYGMACRPLYYIADGLIRLLVEYGTPFRAQTSSLDIDPRFDDSNEVGVVFIQRVVFLGLHTLYIHQNWEKVITLAIRFDDATKYVLSLPSPSFSSLLLLSLLFPFHLPPLLHLPLVAMAVCVCVSLILFFCLDTLGLIN